MIIHTRGLVLIVTRPQTRQVDEKLNIDIADVIALLDLRNLTIYIEKLDVTWVRFLKFLNMIFF